MRNESLPLWLRRTGIAIIGIPVLLFAAPLVVRLVAVNFVSPLKPGVHYVFPCTPEKFAEARKLDDEVDCEPTWFRNDAWPWDLALPHDWVADNIDRLKIYAGIITPAEVAVWHKTENDGPMEFDCSTDGLRCDAVALEASGQRQVVGSVDCGSTDPRWHHALDWPTACRWADAPPAAPSQQE